jgi:hypothetical protein
MEATARAGWTARAVLYLVVAALVARVPSTGGTRKADKTGAFEAIADAPLGRVSLGVVVAGMAAFAVWRAWSAVRGTDEKVTRRLAWLGSALVYALLAALGTGVLLRGGGSGGDHERALTARALGWPGGELLVGAAGLVALAIAGNALQKGVRERFLRDVDQGAVPRPLRPGVVLVGVLGWVGRSLVWALVGWFVVRAAIQHDPNEPVGLDSSLRALAGESWGELLVWIAVGGLLAYGLLCVATALWPDPEPDARR